MTSPFFFKQDLTKMTVVSSSGATLVGRFVDPSGDFSSSVLTMPITGNAEISLLTLYNSVASGKLPEGVFECQVATGSIYIDWRAYPHGTVNTNVISACTLVRRGTFLILGNRGSGYPRGMKAQTLGICSANTNSSATGSTITVEFYDSSGRNVPLYNGTTYMNCLTLYVSGGARSLTSWISSYGYEASAEVPGLPDLAYSGMLFVETTSACALVYNRGGSPHGGGTNGFYDTITAPASNCPNKLTQGSVLRF